MKNVIKISWIKDADEFINYIVDGAKRMQQLLDDLLEYATITKESKNYEEVKLEEVVDESIKNLKFVIEKNNAQIEYDSLPSIVAIRTQLIQLFQNLISNAIKFQSKETPHIHISAQFKGDRYIFSVKDNGIGIDPKYQKHIFKVFKKLHCQDEYDGTGIGLSIVKKILENHNGHIWIRSKLGEGSTFFFTILV